MFVSSFCELSNTLKLWGLAFRSLSQGVAGVMGGLGLFFVFCFPFFFFFLFSSCNSPSAPVFLLHSLIGLQSSCF